MSRSGRFLTEIANFPQNSAFYGGDFHQLPSTEKTTVDHAAGIDSEPVGDGWQWFRRTSLFSRLEAVAGSHATGRIRRISAFTG